MKIRFIRILLLILVMLSITAILGCNGNFNYEKETTAVQQNNKETDVTLPVLPAENLETQNKEETVYRRWYEGASPTLIPVSYTHLTLPTMAVV